ncbi:S-4TM family putative pore-forming effector [Actinomadura sp. LOL_016]|uniref:5-methylcytosine restriction system specificity protein McrC n=1 Tax=unclassified Actinomadura TaxID=2626254 RepID=UPI003A80F02E
MLAHRAGSASRRRRSVRRLGAGCLVISRTALSWLENRANVRGARMQELYETELFLLPWNDPLVGELLPPEGHGCVHGGGQVTTTGPSPAAGTDRAQSRAAALTPWRETRLNRRYIAALRLAELVLRNQSVETLPGRTPIATFVADMPTVFEDFVTTALIEALRDRPGRTEAQYPTYLDIERRVPIGPDLLHLVGDRPVLVADAK